MFFTKIKEMSKIVREIDVDEIDVAEGRIRKHFAPEALGELAKSIKSHGVIEPLIVRRGDSGAWELIAGERRLRAAALAGLERVPCLTVEADDVRAAILAIIENLHREDLNIFEEAAAIAGLISLGEMTQEAAARRLGVSQSYVANKMRLLRFSLPEREKILEHGLSERHCRALLRLSDEGERLSVLDTLISRGYNVASAEAYIESLICAQSRAEEIKSAGEKSEMRRKLIIKDIRVFYNSIDSAVDIIKKSGIPVESSRSETPEGTLISILLPRNVS